MIYVPNIAVIASKAAAKEPIITAAGFKRRCPVSKPLPYIAPKTVRAKKVPPVGMLPSTNESKNDKEVSHNKSKKPMLRLEYERHIRIKLTIVTSDDPPRAKIENNGAEKAFILRCSPRLSLPCRIIRGNVILVFPEKNAVRRAAIEAYNTRYGCGSWHKKYKIAG